MATHTPGPWTIEKTSDGYGVRAPQWGYVAIHHSSGLKHWEEGQAANRLLIAAAPDLLEALQKLLRIQNDVEVLGEWEALDINTGSRKKTRAKVDEIHAQACAAVKKAIGA
jgi:hypothetical protein